MEPPNYLELCANFPSLTICDYCEGLPRDSPRFLHNIWEGSVNGCGLCSILRQGILQVKEEVKDSDAFKLRALNCVKFSGIEQDACGRDVCMIEFNDDPELRSRLVLQLFRDTSPIDTATPTPEEERRFLLPRDVPTKLEFSRVATLTKQWLASCEQIHLRCGLSEYPTLPKRVLDISSRETGDVKLVELRGVKAPYIALSYCWGNAGTNFKTTSATISQHLREIPWNDLPQCFQDAIALCHALQIRYLWIDALCIIQDSTDDWEIESAKMADIYSNAFLTIAASSLSNPSGSLFSDRFTSAQTVSSTIPTFPTGTGFIVAQDQEKIYKFRRLIETAHYQLTSQLVPYSPNPDAPLITRGWAFQERLLSPRTLHFHSEELVWECRTSIRCECGDVDDDSPHPIPELFQERLKSSISMVKSSVTSRTALSESWMDLVSRYSELELSFEGDRLPALSGLAALFSNSSLGDYVTGMWMGMLPIGLLYQCRYPPSSRVSGPSEIPLRAPSWSWASLPIAGANKINYILASHNFKEQCPDFSVFSVKSKVLGKNPFGWVKYARLSVRGRCTECYIVMVKDVANDCPVMSLAKSRVASQVPENVERVALDPLPYAIEHNTRALFLYLGSDMGLVLQRMGAGPQNSIAYRRLGIVTALENAAIWKEHLKVRDINLE